MKRFFAFLLCLVLMVGMLLPGQQTFATGSPEKTPPAASLMATSTVTTYSELVAAINQGDDVLLAADFQVTDTVAIPATYAGTISSETGNTLTLAPGVTNMFRISGATVTFDKVNLDGNGAGRMLYLSGGANVTYGNGKLSNGTTANDGQVTGGAIYGEGSSLTIQNAEVTNNKAVYNADVHGADASAHGGAIFMTQSPLVKVENSTISSNQSGEVNGDGGAIYITNSQDVQIHGNTFTGNHTAQTNVGGYQGGAIKVRSTTNYAGSDNIFNVASTFNTGGAIKFEGVEKATINNDTYTMASLGGAYGVSGGAIASEGTNLTVDSSTFTVSGNSKLTYAGGVFTIVGTGSFNLLNSTLTGRGVDNALSTATYGGAIAFETGSTVTSLIENTSIQNFHADQSGGAITVGTKFGDTGTAVNLTLRNSTIENTGTLLWSEKFIGGAIYVGIGNTLLVDGGTTIGIGRAAEGGLIYNHGTTTITGESSLSGGIAYFLGGGIYNNGVLTLDDMSLDSNFVGPNSWAGNPHPNKTDEYGGVNIYAAKDVTITPNATVSTDDIRVLDKTSAVILTGALVNPLYVSISETPQETGAFLETPQRYIGYTVAKGDGTYVPVKADAQLIHYATKKGDGAAIADHTSVGTWDYLLSPNARTIVLGQRAQMIYHANGTGAEFPDGTTETNQNYDVYSSTAPWSAPLQMTALADEMEPSRPGYVFAGWYDKAVTDAEVAADRNSNLFDFANTKFTNSTQPITTILDPNVIHAYAGWLPPYEVIHQFISGTAGMELPQSVLDLLPENQIDKVNGDVVTPTQLTTTEVTVTGGKWVFDSWDKTTATIDNANVTFMGTWKFVADTATPPENPTDPVVPAEPTPQEVTPGKDPGSVKPVKEASPKTGDESSAPMGALLLLLTGAAMVVTGRKIKINK